MSATLAAAIALLAVTGALVVVCYRLHRRAAALERQLSQLAPAAAEPAGDTLAEVLITIEILNPMEVAASRSKLADVFGNLTPGLVKREVYRQTRAMLEEQLREHGVAAEVQVQRAA